ncbi:hypothetical protein DFQ26_000562 [Actinomortierella ambigua]|nr:hypothetical protein DFQ26_000562 [Actinomortierella ambigua]
MPSTDCFGEPLDCHGITLLDTSPNLESTTRRRRVIGRMGNARLPLCTSRSGRKADGAILSCTPVMELGVMEASKADDGPHSTKALSNTIKMVKVLKDQFNRIYQASTVDIQVRLRTYGLCIVAGTVYFYDLRHLHGRWYRLTCHGTVSFPDIWRQNGGNTDVLLSTISSLLAFKRHVSAMASSVEQWLEPVSGQPEPVEPADKAVPATLTTPTGSPQPTPTT